MSYRVEVYDVDTLVRVASFSLMSLVRRSALRMLGNPTAGSVHLRLLMYPVPHAERDAGPPILDNLLPNYGHARLLIDQEGSIIYQHPHTIFELIGEPLRHALTEAGLTGPRWGFRVAGPDIPDTIARPAPVPDAAALVHPYAHGQEPSFQIRRLPDPEPPTVVVDTASLREVAPPRCEPTSMQTSVVVNESVYEALDRGRPFSDRVEEGGFLIGRVFAQTQGRYMVEITAAEPAEHTGASLLHFTFTGDSFDSIKGVLTARKRGEMLVGWYHTHLFAAANRMGLSSIDLELHFTTFQKPWQLAGLINIVHGRRTLRFYVREENEMRACPTSIASENAPWYTRQTVLPHSAPG